MTNKKLGCVYIFLAFFALGQSSGAATTDVAPIPFVYLNQYFNFQIISDHEIKLAETPINLDDFKISTQGKQIVLDIKEVKGFKSSNAAFLIKPKDPKNKDARLAVMKDKSQYVFTAPFEILWICLAESSAFTKIEICKNGTVSTADSKSSFKPAVKIDGVLFDGSGIVVLKDNLESVSFEAQISESNMLRMTTKKRKIYPRRIEKTADQDFLQIQFVDVNLANNNSWSDKLNVDQTYFDIALDPLIKLRQDIFYKNENVKSSEINYVYVENKKPAAVPVFQNDATAEFFGIHFGLGGQSTTLKASLISDLGKGVRFSSKQLINSKMDAHFSGALGQINFISDSANRFYNTGQSFFSVSGGVSYHLKNKFDIFSKLEIRKDFFFRRHDLTSSALDIVSGLNKEISISPSWTFLKRTNSLAHFQFGFSYLLASTAESETINSGLGYKFGLDYIYQLPFGNLKLETYYYKRQQNSDSFTFNEQTAFYSLGYQYLF